MTDTLHSWYTTAKRTIYETSIFSLEEHQRSEDATGKHGTFYVVDAPSWINVIAITRDGKFVLVEQFRHGSGKFEIEIVGGDTDDEEPLAAALRELKEETGYEPTASSRVELIGTTKPNPAFMANTCYTFLVTDVEQTAGQQFDEFERIRVSIASYDEVMAMIRNGTIDHTLVLTAFLWYQLNVLGAKG